jgi:NAD-specific glutamate dehydrogenase
VCDELIGGRALRAAIHACDYTLPAAAQYEALLAVEEVNRALLRWWIWNDRAWSLSPDDVGTLRPEFDAAAEALLASLDPAGKAAMAAREQALIATGFSPTLAAQLTRVEVLGQAFAVLHSARENKLPLAGVAKLYQRVGRELHVDAFDELLAQQVPANGWERRFLATLERESAAIRQLGVFKLASEPGYIEKHRDRIAGIADSLRMVKQFGGHGLVPMYLILEDYKIPW